MALALLRSEDKVLVKIPLCKIDDKTCTPVAMTALCITKAEAANLEFRPDTVKKLEDLITCRGLEPAKSCDPELMPELIPVRVCENCLHLPKFALWNGFTEDGEPAWVEDPFPDGELQAKLTMPELYLYIQFTELMDRLFPCQKGQ